MKRNEITSTKGIEDENNHPCNIVELPGDCWVIILRLLDIEDITLELRLVSRTFRQIFFSVNHVTLYSSMFYTSPLPSSTSSFDVTLFKSLTSLRIIYNKEYHREKEYSIFYGLGSIASSETCINFFNDCCKNITTLCLDRNVFVTFERLERDFPSLKKLILQDDILIDLHSLPKLTKLQHLILINSRNVWVNNIQPLPSTFDSIDLVEISSKYNDILLSLRNGKTIVHHYHSSLLPAPRFNELETIAVRPFVFEKFEGILKNGKAHGKGRLSCTIGDKKGSYFEGNFLNDSHSVNDTTSILYDAQKQEKFVGKVSHEFEKLKGVLTSTQEAFKDYHCEGVYEKNKLTIANERFCDLSIFTGRYILLPPPKSMFDTKNTNERKIVQGKLRKSDGSIYKGEFMEIEPKGYHHFNCVLSCKEGVYISPCGNYVYKGEFMNNNVNGQGELKAPTFFYRGEVKDNVPHGKGLFIDKRTTPNVVYDGIFSRGKIRGKGSCFYDNEVCSLEYKVNHDNYMKGMLFVYYIYTGQFEDGYFSGIGTIYNENMGFIHEGRFTKGLPNGEGKRYLFNDRKILLETGNYQNGELNGKGSRFQRNGSFYEGFFKDGKLCGHGKFVIPKEKKEYIGTFQDSLFHGKIRTLTDSDSQGIDLIKMGIMEPLCIKK